MSHSLMRSVLAACSLLVGCGEIGLQTVSPPPEGTLSGMYGDTGADVDDPGTNSGGNNAGGGGANGGDQQSEEGGSSGGGGGAFDCTYDDFPIQIHQATQDNSIPNQPLFMYQARSSEQMPFDELQILSYQAAPYNGPTSPGTHVLDGSNYADCALCVLLVTDCNNNYQCDQVFFVDQGVLDIERLSVQGGPFLATLRDAVFLEVTIDPNTYETTPVPGGDSWCIDEINIDVSTYVYN